MSRSQKRLSSPAKTPDRSVLARHVPAHSRGAVCPDVGFVEGTLIDTEFGPKPIHHIAVGDLIVTLDHGLQPVRDIAQHKSAAIEGAAAIRFAPGAIGNQRALRVSPEQKILVSDWRAELFFGEEEVLVPAKYLVNSDTIHATTTTTCPIYYQFMFDTDEIVFAEGIPTRVAAQGTAATRPHQSSTLCQAHPTDRTVLGQREARILCGDIFHAS